MSPVVAMILTAALIYGTLGIEHLRSKRKDMALTTAYSTIEKLLTRLSDPVANAAIDLNTKQQVDLMEAQLNYETGVRQEFTPPVSANGSVAEEDLIGGMNPRDIEDLM